MFINLFSFSRSKAFSVKCPVSGDLSHGYVKIQGQAPGDRLSVKCEVGFWLDGPQDGKWSGGAPVCRGKVNTRAVYHRWKLGKVWLYVTCNTGLVFVKCE